MQYSDFIRSGQPALANVSLRALASTTRLTVAETNWVATETSTKYARYSRSLDCITEPIAKVAMQATDSVVVIMAMKLILRFWTALRAAGPYLLIELLLPGGTLIAFLLWLSQRFTRSAPANGQSSPSRGQGTPVGGVKPANVPEIGSIKPLGAALR